MPDISLTFAILTISDSCCENKDSDKSGPALKNLVSNPDTETGKLLGGKVLCSEIVCDDESMIERALIEYTDKVGVNVVLTTGGTGLSSRDVTPEVTRRVIEREVTGLTHAMMAESLKVTPMAMLSRSVCGVRGRSLIINLPGSPKAATECFEAIASTLPHAVELILDADVRATHESIQQQQRGRQEQQQEQQQYHAHRPHLHSHRHHHPHFHAHHHHHHPHHSHHSHHPYHPNHHSHHHNHHSSSSNNNNCNNVVERARPYPALDLENVADRDRESPYTLIDVNEALRLMRSVVKQNQSDAKERVPLYRAYGRVLAEEVISTCDLPPFRASIKDGYAVRASDGAGKRNVLSVVIQAGSQPAAPRIIPGYCARINTGAPVPEDATAVVQVEDTRLLEASTDGREERAIEILVEPREGQDIRELGCDMRSGDKILQPGQRLGPVEFGLLASCGLNEVVVVPRLRVGVISIGSELQDPGQPLFPGLVYDINGIMLMSLVSELGYEETLVRLDKIDDFKHCLIRELSTALRQCDVIVTTGSLSMGDRDYLKSVLKDSFGATIHFGRVNLKPGKPTTFATVQQYPYPTRYILCLPGNPVSAFVTAHVFLVPLLKFLNGQREESVVLMVKLTSAYELDPRPEYVRVWLEYPVSSSDASDCYPRAHITGGQASSNLLGSRDVSALLMLPGRTSERPSLAAGELVPAMLLGYGRQVA